MTTGVWKEGGDKERRWKGQRLACIVSVNGSLAPIVVLCTESGLWHDEAWRIALLRIETLG